MKIKITLAWGALMLTAALPGMVGGACRVDLPSSIRQAGEDTSDGGLLTDAMTGGLRGASPGTDPTTCRYHVGDGSALVITCDDGTYLEWS